MPVDAREQLRRIADARAAIARRLATRVIPFDGGTAYLDEDFPRRYDANYLHADAAGDLLDAPALGREADRILGGAGLEHREVVVPDETQAAALSPGFVELGYAVDRVIVMLHDAARRPATPPDDGARIATFAEVRPFLVELGRRAPWGADAEVVEILADYRGKLAGTIDCTFVVAEAEGRIVSGCELYLEAGVAQIEDVNTLEGFRGRGLARACVNAAVDLARDRGAEVVFLEADVDDWPQELYRRMGFVDADRYRAFVRLPPSDPRLARAGSDR